ncbi:MarR family winged helix-turn-helix transcriptional regulator [Streptomyces qinglanensis]|uniref:DNA-binding transcriptional regulator, MarR family n=1 Tax=Streptomyces qinglanensis TaxID=943816 RepID=A0A1H9TD40_9ACTN|nr:MarR family transcriptional regulator [Streptomyces qinglanensis]SER94854.1 DNA-binding transcriptional regulator, MarR family [Streptomyces qinglanensis]
MGGDPSLPGGCAQQAGQRAGEIIELLEVLWEQGRNATARAPVSPSQLRVMYCVDRDEGMNLRALGEALGSAPSSVSRLCDRLEAIGFVARSPSPTSGRELELRLTPQGRAHLRDLRERREEALLGILATMPPGDREALLTGLRGFADAAANGSSECSRPVSPATP